MAVLRRVLDEDGLPAGLRGEVRLYVGLLLDNQAGQATAGLAELARAVPELRRRPGLAARAMSALAVPMSTTGHLAEHLDWMKRALEAAERANDPVLRTAVLVNRATVLMHVADPQAWRAVLDLMRGRWSDLEERLHALTQAFGDVPLVFAEAELVLGLLSLARGELAVAKAHLGAAREVGSTGGSVPVVVAAAGGLARIALARGDAGAAAAQALPALELVERKGVFVWTAEVAPPAVEALLSLDRRAEAEELVAHVVRGLRGRDAPAAQAALLTCQAFLQRDEAPDERALRALRRAERAWRVLPCPYRAVQLREAEAHVLLEGGDGHGMEVLLGSLEEFKALGAEWDAARVRRELRAHGVTRPWRGGRKGYGDELSPREHEVLRLAALGQTNREIAEALVLSPRTVESHLANAMRKAGVSSRRQLASA
jgi:DNA-binding CsgD family transcriptional regulator